MLQRCEGIPLELVACKVDLSDQRIVKSGEGEAEAKKNGMGFLESSAKTDFQVNDVFQRLAEKIWDKYEKTGQPWDKT